MPSSIKYSIETYLLFIILLTLTLGNPLSHNFTIVYNVWMWSTKNVLILGSHFYATGNIPFEDKVSR